MTAADLTPSRAAFADALYYASQMLAHLADGDFARATAHGKAAAAYAELSVMLVPLERVFGAEFVADYLAAETSL